MRSGLYCPGCGALLPAEAHGHVTESAESQATTGHLADQAAAYQISSEAPALPSGPIPHLGARVLLTLAIAAVASALLYLVLTPPVVARPSAPTSHPTATPTQPLQTIGTPAGVPAFDNADATAAAGLITPTPRRSSGGSSRATATPAEQPSQSAPPPTATPTPLPPEARPTATATPSSTPCGLCG